MSGGRSGYRRGAPIPYRPDQPAPEKRYGFHPAQYHKAQANDVYLQYQRQVARDKAETLKKRSERNLDGKLKINNLELVFLTINSRRWFGISQIVSVLFSHRPRSSVVTRMKMLGIEFYCGNYDELRRMKELGGVETHCSRCKLISEQDLVKLLLCFYRFTALPRGKGKISTNGLSTYLDDILREIAMGRVELGRDFQEDDTGKIDEDTWSQISERMLLKNAERVEHYTRVPAPKKKDTFAFDVDNEEFVMPGNPSRYIPRSQRVVRGNKIHAKLYKTEDPHPTKESPAQPKEAATTDVKKAEVETKEEGKQESMSLLLPKLIRAERTKKPPRAIWPRWYPPTGESDSDASRPTITMKSSSPSSPESGVSLPAIQCFFNHLKSAAPGTLKKQEFAKYILEGQRSILDPGDVKEVKIKRDTGEECIVSLEELTFQDIKFGEDDIIQIVTRQDLEEQYSKQRSDAGSRKNSDEQSDSENKDGETKEPLPPKPEPIEYTPEQLEYVQKLKESFDFPYAFPRNKMSLKKEFPDYDLYDAESPHLMRPHMPHFRRNPIVDNQIFKKLMAQKRPVLVRNRGRDTLSSEMSGHGPLDLDYEVEPNSSALATEQLKKDAERNGIIAKTSIIRPNGSIIKSKLIRCNSHEKLNRWKTSEDEKKARDRVHSDPVATKTEYDRGRAASDSALAKESGRESPFLLSDDSGTMSDGELTEGEVGRRENRNRPRKRFRKFSPGRERLGSGGSSEGDEENVKPDHVYRFKFKSVSETQDYPYMSARPSSLLRLVKLDKCDYPVGCRSAPFLFDTRPLSRVIERGPFVRQYDIEPTSENVWSGVSLWAGDDSDNSDSSSNNGGSQSAPELEKCTTTQVAQLPATLLRKIVSAGNSPVRNSPKKSGRSSTPDLTGLDILSSVAYNADRLRNTPTKRQRTPKKVQTPEPKRVTPIKLQVKHIQVASKRKTETNEKELSKSRKIDT